MEQRRGENTAANSAAFSAVVRPSVRPSVRHAINFELGVGICVEEGLAGRCREGGVLAPLTRSLGGPAASAANRF